MVLHQKENLSYLNPNYQLVSQDENSNLGSVEEFENLYEKFDSVCQCNRKAGTDSRLKYAQLDPISMGVEQSQATDYMNLQMTHGTKLDFPADATNKSVQLGKSIEQKTPLCSISNKCMQQCTFPIDAEESELPAGWEKHEDDSGPYYWHISSGTIQRESPARCGSNYEMPSSIVKEMDFASSLTDISKQKSSSPLIGDPQCSKSISLGENKFKVKSFPEELSKFNVPKRPIRFAVRSLGWVEIAEDDLTPEKSSKAVNNCIVELSSGKNDILDTVGRWGDGKDLFMDLDNYSLELTDTQDLTVLNSQPIHSIRVWGVGRDNGRDFAYVARDRINKKYMCHVFRCDIPARIIANTLRDICKKIMIERSSQHHLSKSIFEELNSDISGSHPPNVEHKIFLNPECQNMYTDLSFPTPMEEPKKMLKVHYLGSTSVNKATGVEVLNDAIEKLMSLVSPAQYKFVNVAVAPSTITIIDAEKKDKVVEEFRVRYLSFLGIGKDIKHCGFIVHTAEDQFVAHVFYCEPSSGALCKTVEAACKLRYQKCLDARRKFHEGEYSKSLGNKGLVTTIRSILGSIGRLTKSSET